MARAIRSGRRTGSSDASQGRGASWSPLGVIAFAPGAFGAIFQVADTGGPPTPLTKLNDEGESQRLPRFRRRPIDEETGKPLGEPEPVTSGGQWNGQLSISKTGQILYADLISSSSVERFPLDPATGRVVGAPSLILGSSREIGEAVPSPDGRWVLMTSKDTQEDLLVAAADGTGMRRITSDRFKERIPRWGPDSALIYFISDRTGRYENWRIHRDGSGLEQITSTEGGPRADPCPSPDGRILAVYGMGKIEESCGLVDLTAPLPQHSLTYLPLFDKTHGFLASCWSPEGKRLAGSLRTASTTEPGVVIYSLETKTFERVSESGSPIAWFPDGRRVLVQDRNGLMTVDVETRKTQPVLDKLGHGVQTAALARDGRSLLAVRSDVQADIWMLSAQEPTTDTPAGR